MRFEERELKPYAEPISTTELKEGKVYFSLNFADRDMLIPFLEPLVFIGRNLNSDDVETVLYFQNCESYLNGVRFQSATTQDLEMSFQCGTENQMRHIFEYEHALDGLMLCALRR